MPEQSEQDPTKPAPKNKSRGRKKFTNAALTKEFRRYQSQKTEHEKRWIESLLYYHGMQYHYVQGGRIGQLGKDDNNIRLTVNYTRKRTDQFIGRASAADPVFRAKPDTKKPDDMSNAEVVDQMVLATSQKLDEPELDWEKLYWMALTGNAFEYTRWMPDKVREPVKQMSPNGELMWEDQEMQEVVPQRQAQVLVQQGAAPERFKVYEKMESTGDIDVEILGPLNVFCPNSIKSLKDLAPGQSVMIAKVRTRGWIEQNYPGVKNVDKLVRTEDIRIVKTDLAFEDAFNGRTSVHDLIPVVQGKVTEDDPDMFVLIERFTQPDKEYPRGRYTAFVPNQEFGVLVDDDSPYEYGFPVVDYHFTRGASFWKNGLTEMFLSMQDFINKRISQAAEFANANVQTPWLLGPGIQKGDVPRDVNGFVEKGLSAEGIPLVQQLQVQGPGGWFTRTMEEGLRALDSIAGQDLFTERQFPGQLRGPSAVPMLQEIKDSEWKPLFQHISQQKAKAVMTRIGLIRQFYPAERVMHYVSRDLTEEVLIFNADDILRSGVDYRVSVEPGTIMPEMKALNEARISERFNNGLGQILYSDDRTGMIDKAKLAMDLKFGDIGRVSAEAAARKMASQAIKLLWQGRPVPVIPFQNHAAHLDELVAEMETMEWLNASPQVQQVFMQHMQERMEIQAQQAAQAQEAAQQQAMAATANQVAQQTAAATVQQTVEQALPQIVDMVLRQQGAGGGQLSPEAGPALLRNGQQMVDPALQ